MAIKWAIESEDATKDEAYFEKVPKRFATVSQKLAAVLTEKAEGELGRKITHKSEEYVKKGRSAPGLVLLKIVHEYYATSKHAEVVYNITDLQKVQIKAGNVEGFQNSWEMVLQGMKKVPDDETLEHLYYEAIKTFPGVHEDVAHYERQDEDGGGERSYKFLHDAVDRHIRRRRQLAVRVAMDRMLGKSPVVTQPVAPAAGDGGGGARTPGDRRDRQGICRYYERGKCNKGDKCRYKHADPEIAESSQEAQFLKEPKEVCILFQQGRCRFGEKCKYAHVDADEEPAPKAKANAAVKGGEAPAGAAPAVAPPAVVCRPVGAVRNFTPKAVATESLVSTGRPVASVPVGVCRPAAAGFPKAVVETNLAVQAQVPESSPCTRLVTVARRTAVIAPDDDLGPAVLADSSYQPPKSLRKRGRTRRTPKTRRNPAEIGTKSVETERSCGDTGSASPGDGKTKLAEAGPNSAEAGNKLERQSVTVPGNQAKESAGAETPKSTRRRVKLPRGPCGRTRGRSVK